MIQDAENYSRKRMYARGVLIQSAGRRKQVRKGGL